MKIEEKPVSFKWSNYTKPTPRNLKMFMEFWKGFVVVVTSSAAFNGAGPWAITASVVLGYIIDRLVKFFAFVEEDQARQSVKIEYPADMADQVTITKQEEPSNE